MSRIRASFNAKTGFKGSRIRGFEWKKDRVQGVEGSRMQVKERIGSEDSRIRVEERKGTENSMGKMYYLPFCSQDNPNSSLPLEGGGLGRGC